MYSVNKVNSFDITKVCLFTAVEAFANIFRQTNKKYPLRRVLYIAGLQGMFTSNVTECPATPNSAFFFTAQLYKAGPASPTNIYPTMYYAATGRSTKKD